MPFPNINPVIISFGKLAISWYSLSYVVGILIAWFYANKIVSTFDINIKKTDLENFVTWAIIGIIIGGRLGHVLFYNPEKYLAHPIEVLKTYEGGMSFHGGFLGLVIASYLFCKKHKLKFLTFGDIMAIVSPIGLFLGRIANFINAEAYGVVTDVPWAVIFPNTEGSPRHPSQLYEAFCEGFLAFIILSYVTFKFKTIKKPGLNSGLFLIIYSTSRIILEIFREPDWNIGYILQYFTMGQILSLPMFFLGIFLLRKAVDI